MEISGRLCVHDSSEVKARGTDDRVLDERERDVT